MIIKGSKIISRLPDGTGIAEGFQFEFDDESAKQLIRIAASELVIDSGVGELLAASEKVLQYRGQIIDYPPSYVIERTERIPESALDRLETAVKNVQNILSKSSKPE